MRCPSVGSVTATLVAGLLLAACGSSEPVVTQSAEPVPEAPAIAFATEEDPVVEESSAAPAESVDQAGDEPPVGDGLFPTVVAAEARSADGTSWRFDVTLLSEYDSPARYADAWRVLDADDNELGVRVLGHDHANEQPFTRSHNIDVPGGTTTVFVEGRDQVNGWSGERFELALTS